MPVFVDTNVLVYARDTADPAKHARASEWVADLWERADGRLSVQVLQEYYVTTTRKLRPGLAPEEARADVLDLAAWSPVVTDIQMLASAWTIEERFGLSIWDALIVAAAQVARCDVLLTEDMQHGMDLDGVRVTDPFRVGPAELG
ncbi:MAG: PIN domain-containing protein [Actinomycetota bacterium]|nr:PIN domain-containing protein [Actinomycetota bacterium]